MWAKVTATIRPLSRNPLDTQPIVVSTQPAVGQMPKGRTPPARPEQPFQQPAKIPRQETLDGSWDRRLGRGRVEPDRTLDLHGHSLDRAWQAIDRALECAIDDGERVLLLVTGHERKGDPPLERGRIRAAVHDWLAVSRHAPKIAAVRGAHLRHGGGGSLYIILRRS